jgi:hypothetical protein
MKRPSMLDPKSYIDYDKIPMLVSLVKEVFDRIDLFPYKVDIGEKNVGQSIRWYSVILIPHKTDDVYYIKYEHLETSAAEIIAYARSMAGLERLVLNILEPCSVVPMHYDNEDDSDNGEVCSFYNLLIPLDSNGYSIVNDRIFKNHDGEPLVFDPQSHHGAMNDTLDIRRNFFCRIRNEAFRTEGI